MLAYTWCLGQVSYLATVPRSSAMTCLDKVSSPTIDTVTQSTACIDTVPQPSTISRHGASAYCHDMPRQDASA